MDTMTQNIHESTFISKSSVIIGTVIIKKNCGVFPNAVIRGDQNTIFIDEGSNVQDCCVIHCDKVHNVKIGKNVSIGHGAIVHGATIEDDCLIGMNATILNGVKLRRGTIVGANALVTSNTEIPEDSLVLGVPGKIVKQDESFSEVARKNAKTYQKLSKDHKDGKFSHFIIK